MVKKTNPKLWDFWSKHYFGLWAQNWALGPTRVAVVKKIQSFEKAPMTILDMGCGVGQLCSDMHLAFPESDIRGLDISEGMIETAKEKFGNGKLTFSRETLDEHEGQYDLITSTHSFPYIIDKMAALKKIKSMLKPGGRFILVMANTDNFYDVIALLVVKMTTWDSDYVPTRKLCIMLEETGFKNINYEAFKVPFFVPTINLISAEV